MAALLAIGAGSYGLIVALGGGGARLATDARSATLAAGLTTVNGCSTLAGTSGTLEQVTGSDLVIMTSGGQSVPVTTSASTNIGAEASGSLEDITNGTEVVVNGTGSDGTIAAASVGVGAVGTVKMTPPTAGLLGGRKTSLAAGTIADAGTGGFTVVEANGANVAVTTSSLTKVVTLLSVDVGQLQVGEFTIALGTPSQGVTLAASRVEQGEALSTSSLPKPPPTFGMAPLEQKPGAQKGFCSSSAVATTADLLAN